MTGQQATGCHSVYLTSGHSSANYQWVNPGLFTQNAVGTFGNAGHFSLRTPSYFDVDASISRKFNLGEHFQTEASGWKLST